MSNSTVQGFAIGAVSVRRIAVAIVLLVVGLVSRGAYAAPLTISPPSASVSPMGTQMFTASGGTGMGYMWSLSTNASGGNITAGGLYTAGSTSNVVDQVQVMDSLAPEAGADASTSTATAAVMVGSGITVMPATATVMAGGSQTFTASGGTPPYAWALTASGSGMPAVTPVGGVYTAGAMAGMDSVTATDSVGNTATATITVTVMAVTTVGIGQNCILDGGATAPCPAGATCVDGVCCSSACSGQCQACNLSGSVGTCVTITGSPIGNRSACPMSDPMNLCSALTCDGTSGTACTKLVGPETPCGTASCIDGIGTPGAVCQGDGGCQTVVPQTCGVYGCVSGKCASSCTQTSECSPGNYCDVTSRKCIKPAPLPDAGAGAGGDAGSAALPTLSGGCSMGSGPGASPVLMAIGLLTSVGLLIRRRRR